MIHTIVELDTLKAFRGLILHRATWGVPLILGLPVLSDLPFCFCGALARDDASATWRA